MRVRGDIVLLHLDGTRAPPRPRRVDGKPGEGLFELQPRPSARPSEQAEERRRSSRGSEPAHPRDGTSRWQPGAAQANKKHQVVCAAGASQEAIALFTGQGRPPAEPRSTLRFASLTRRPTSNRRRNRGILANHSLCSDGPPAGRRSSWTPCGTLCCVRTNLCYAAST